MGRRSIGTVAVLAGLALAAVGCGGASDGARSGGPGSGASGASSADDGGRAAFAFSAPALGGGTVEGSDYADTGVALWFWAPW